MLAFFFGSYENVAFVSWCWLLACANDYYGVDVALPLQSWVWVNGYISSYSVIEFGACVASA